MRTQDLTNEQRDVLVRADEQISAYKLCPFRAGESLTQISKAGIYPRRFLRFCFERYGLTRQKVHRLMKLWRLHCLLTPIGVKLNCESQALALAGLTDEQICAAGKIALELAGSNEALTAKHLRIAAERVNPAKTQDKTQNSRSVADRAKAVEMAEKAQFAEANKDYDSLHSILQDLIAHLKGQDPAEKTRTTSSSNEESDASSGCEAGDSVSVQQPELPAEGAAAASQDAHGEHAAEIAPPRPMALHIDETVFEIRWFNQIPVHVANWAIKLGRSISQARFVHRVKPRVHKNDRWKQLEDGQFIECGDGQPELFSKTRQLLEAAGLKQTSVCVKLSNGETRRIS